jgi:hypothetical protein
MGAFIYFERYEEMNERISSRQAVGYDQTSGAIIRNIGEPQRNGGLSVPQRQKSEYES